MSQWGSERKFAAAHASIRAVPLIDTPEFEQPGPWDRIVTVLVVDRSGAEADAALLVAQAERYVGLPYSDWLHRFPLTP